MKRRTPLVMCAAMAVAGCTSLQQTEREHLNECVTNMRCIEAAKCGYDYAKLHPEKMTLVVKGINDFLPGKRTPVCPDRGTYRYNDFGVDAECSVHGAFSKAVEEVVRRMHTTSPNTNRPH